MFQRFFLIWVLFASVIGFALGGSFVFGLQGQHPATQHTGDASQHHTAEHDFKSKKEETDEALARYTLLLMVFTGILAVATIGLGGATLGLYFTGEKQIRLTSENAIAQSRDMKASVAAAESAVRVSREIGEAQVRAYLSCEGANFAVNGSFISCDIRFRNHGQSPAIWTKVEAHTVTIFPDDTEVGGAKVARSEVIPAVGPAIAAGQVGQVFLLFLDSAMGEGAHEAIWKENHRFDIRGRVSWRDVFGKTQVQAFLLNPEQRSQIFIPETDRDGEMTPYNDADETNRSL